MGELLTNGSTIPFSSMPKVDDQFGPQRTDIFNTHCVLELHIFRPPVQ